jgi:hypothetical protein
MTPNLFYGLAGVFVLMGIGLQAVEYFGDRVAVAIDERKEQRTEEAVNAYFQQATNRELYEDNQPRRLPATAAKPIEPTPELADPFDELAPRVKTGWH